MSTELQQLIDGNVRSTTADRFAEELKARLALGNEHSLAPPYATLQARIAELEALINHPATAAFLSAVRSEVAHQVQRWGTVGDRAKAPPDWFWLVGYLSGKALAAHLQGDLEKALHHCISSAAVLANWWAHIQGQGRGFTPGSSDLQKFLEEQFGTDLVQAVST